MWSSLLRSGHLAREHRYAHIATRLVLVRPSKSLPTLRNLRELRMTCYVAQQAAEQPRFEYIDAVIQRDGRRFVRRWSR